MLGIYPFSDTRLPIPLFTTIKQMFDAKTGFPISFAIKTGFEGKTHPFENPVNWTQLRVAGASGWEYMEVNRSMVTPHLSDLSDRIA